MPILRHYLKVFSTLFAEKKLLTLSICIFLTWLVQAIDLVVGVIFGISSLTKVKGRGPKDGKFPKVSIIFAARNEAKDVEAAARSMLAQDYPDFEVIAVNDRSTDGTLAILESLAPSPCPFPPGERERVRGKLKVLNISALPSGWLGKTHALWRGYLISKGDWLLFTDADVNFHPSTLRASIQAASDYRLDHLALFPQLVTKKIIEAIFAHYFILSFLRFLRPWAAPNPKSPAFVGVGAFNLVRREVYEAIGTHEKLALEVVDDVGLGRRVKKAGYSQRAMSGVDFVSVKWVEGFKGVLASLQKNAFAGMNYQLSLVFLATASIFMLDALPFFLFFYCQWPAWIFSLLTVILIWISNRACLFSEKQRESWLWVAHPLGSLLFLLVLWRSAYTAIRERGIRWRDTFYSLDGLKNARK